ncbi:MAG: hypothetical protein ACI9L6_001135 [Flavobacterium sp.]|jgi:hypothetical protein
MQSTAKKEKTISETKTKERTPIASEALQTLNMVVKR